MIDKALRESRLKLQRAYQHITDLNTHLLSFNASKPYTIRIKPNLEAGCDEIWFDTPQPVPESLLLIVGDALHNLRSALDYLMRGLSTVTDGYSKFPIYATQKKLVDAVNGGLKHKTTPGVIRLIVDAIQPYSGGDGDLLWQLHKLDIIDKHQLLIAQTQLTVVEGMRAVDERGVEFDIPNWLIVHPFVHSHLCEGHRNIEVTDKGNAACNIVFGERMPLTGHLIPMALGEMAVAVDCVIQVVEAASRQGLI